MDVHLYVLGDDLGYWSLGVVPPDDVKRFKMRHPLEAPVADFDRDTSIRGITLDLHFTDAAGNRWLRTDAGELRWLYNLADRAKETQPETRAQDALVMT